MGHVWLGFSEKQIVKLLTGAGFEDPRVRPLPVDPDAKGPALFAAIATRGESRDETPTHERNLTRRT
jgi:ArsR family transcriptional regulator